MTYWFKPTAVWIGRDTRRTRKDGSLSFGFMLIVAAFIAVLMTSDNLSVGLVLAWVAALVAVEMLFVWIAWKKTDGAWRWRWGSKDIGK